MTAIDTLATILIAVGIVKILFLFFKPGKWFTFATKLYKNTILIQSILFLLGGYVLWILINNGFTIIDIFAVMTFMGLLFGFGLAPYITKMMKIIKPKDVLKTNLWYMLVWIALLLWGVYALVTS
jgi:hypothetical protein